MQSSLLLLNLDELEVIVFGNKMERMKVAAWPEVWRQKLRLGILDLTSDLNFNSHVKYVTIMGFNDLKQILIVRDLMSRVDVEKLIHALISRIDFKGLSVYELINNMGPKYISDVLVKCKPI